MCDVTRDLQTPPPLANFHIFSDSFLLWSVKYARSWNIYNAPFSDSEALRPNYSAQCGLL